MRSRLDALLAEAAARGIRVVPDDPGPEFPRVPYACAVRPVMCGGCVVVACPHGQVPGLSGVAVPPRKSALDRILATAADRPVACRVCGAVFRPPDARRVLRLHEALAHGPPDGAA